MNHYETLGLMPSATNGEIKEQYRKLASTHHPDRPHGNTILFQQIQAAYSILRDEQLRFQYDQELRINKQHEVNNFHEIIRRKRKIFTSMIVSLEQLISDEPLLIGIATPLGPKFLKLAIPHGISDSQIVTYTDALQDAILQVQFRILPHENFQMIGNDLHSIIEVNVLDLITGIILTFTDITKKQFAIEIPKLTDPSTTFRLKNLGMYDQNSIRGDQYISLKVRMPDKISDELLSSISSYRNFIK